MMPWYHKLWFKFREVFFCCFKDERDKIMGAREEHENKKVMSQDSDDEGEKSPKVCLCLFDYPYV